MYTFRSFWATVCKTVRAMLSDRCLSVLTVLSCLPVCSVSVGSYCGQTVGYIKMPLGTEVGFGPGYIVLDWDPAAPPPKKKGTAANFWPMLCCGQTAGLIKMPLGTEVGLGQGDIVLEGTQLPPKGAQPPHFRRMSVVVKRLDGSRCHLVRR